ncbi:transporter substrate-binding domain-containing protein [Pseudemcibacter aquimaris]|uniref:transporter substrate-binding domain-containing protein n=1 Tax=Pseudemcibacter aquimaris TaxID=2857064 RepID=UPI002012B0F4|nr:transporter substrate-binding domain-containing protein [Pseudemcibacter aquimaris]MCC3861053.1 transporter substrate-binding domain-containing protein [Pseudemcibacter aquimaris]WDU59871.1 transporter substrate-binding domain-containing protein [Pseudemcibacter aquimaris]
MYFDVGRLVVFRNKLLNFMIKKLFLFSFFVLYPIGVLAQSIDQDNSLLASEEIAWIAQNPMIRATNDMEWEPLDFVSVGKPAGISVDYLNLVASKVGLNVEYVNGYTLDEMLGMLERREIDIAHGISESEERSKFLNFSDTYLSMPLVYFGRKGADPILSIDDLKGKRIGAISGWIALDIYRENNPDLNYVEYSNVGEALIDLSAGKLDVFVNILPVINYSADKNFITNLEILGNEVIPELQSGINLRLAARNDQPILMSILKKGMSQVTEQEFQDILVKWRAIIENDKEIDLTIEERQWLAENPVIKVGFDPTNSPFNILDEDGRLSGISGSFLDIIAKKLNVEFVTAGSQNWNEAMEMIQNGEAHMLSDVTPTPERRKIMTFTDVYLSVSKVIFARAGGTVYGNMGSLSGRKIAQVAGFADTEFLKRDYPSIEVLEVADIGEALVLVSNGEVDAYVGDIPAGIHNITREGLTNIIVAGEAPYQGESAMAARIDLPLLSSILQKAVRSITPAEKADIERRWLSIQVERATDYSLIWKLALGGLVIILLIFIWANSLRREVERRKIVEEKLIKSEKLAHKAQLEAEAANEAKSAFLANMSHEIRTPLNAIIGFSEVMSLGVFGEIKEPKYKEYLHDIEGSGKHLAKVIRDILDLSKIEAGKWQLTENDFDLNNCIIDTIKMLEHQADNKNIRLTFHSDIDQNVLLYGDDVAIKRILINLISNSIKFTEAEGEVDCNLSVLNDGWVRMEVIDNGLGIPEDRLEYVTVPFEQIQKDEELQEEGTGLGLSIVKQLVLMHQGRFEIMSTFGLGTTVLIDFPPQRIANRLKTIRSAVT